MASTDLDVYRPFRGNLRRRVLRFLPLADSEFRAQCKRKIPLLLLFAPPAIGTVIFSFIVYSRYAAEAFTQDLQQMNVMAALLARRAMQNLQVKKQLIEFIDQTSLFALLAVAWYGAGLFAEDRKHGAYQLYFARPITRMDYYLGKFCVAAAFGAAAVVVPGLVISLVAAFASPEWSFLKDEGQVIPQTLLFGIIWVVTISVVVLCASSLFQRKSFALIGVFGFFMFELLLARVLYDVTREVRYSALSTLINLRRMGRWIFDTELERRWMTYDLELACWQLAAIATIALLVTVFRLRKLEVVA